jgi:prevent-host-death family protein
MRLSDAVRPVTELKNRTAELIEEVRASREPVVITQRGRASAVLIDVETFDQWRETLAMLKVVQRGEQGGRGASTERVMERARARLRRRRK